MLEFNIPNQEADLEQVEELLNKVHGNLRPLEKAQKTLKGIDRKLKENKISKKERAELVEEREIANAELIKLENKLSSDQKEKVTKLLSDILYKVGDMSIPIFEIRETMEEKYAKKYVKSPALGKKLYLEHYENVHKPFDKLKNRTFKVINILDPFDDEELDD